MSDKHFVGLKLTSAINNRKQRPISRVTLWVDDNSVLTAGDDTGVELQADCPHATQAMVNAILNQVKGMEYQMYDASDLRLDPAAELGDGITVGGIYSVISRLSDDGSGFPSASAPGQAELEDEYPAGGPMTQAFDRKIAETRSSITKTADEIRLEVYNEIQGLSSSIDIKLDSITLRVQGAEGNISTLTQTATSLQSQITNARGDISTLTQTANSLQSQITNANGEISSISQKVNNIRLYVSNGEKSSTIELDVNGINVSTQTVRFNGDVVFENDLSDGTTTISGNCIKTGKIDSEYIQLGGQLTVYTNPGYGSIVGGYLGYVTGVDADGYPTSGIGIMYNQYNGQCICTNAGARLGYGSSSSVTCTSNGVFLKGSRIVANGSLQTPDGTAITSDRNAKEDIRNDIDRYLPLFDRLRPASYRLKNRTRRHIGFIAQDVEEAMKATGIESKEFAGLVIDEDGKYALRYEEFIPLIVAKIQNIEKKMEVVSRGT